MSAHLQLVEGEVPDCVRCDNLAAELQAKDDEIRGLQRDIRGWTIRYANLERDKEHEALNHELWDEAEGWFDYWRKHCRHPNSSFDADRFFLVLPYLKKPGAEMVKRAIDGAAYDAWETKRKNGSTKRHDSWEKIFESRGKFEDFCNRAPRAAA